MIRARIGELLPQVRPQFFFSPPRLWEKLRAATIAKLGDSPDGATALAALGLDEVRVAITGAAPCPAEVIEFWHGLGLPLCEVYGMSETTGVATVNAPERGAEPAPSAARSRASRSRCRTRARC